MIIVSIINIVNMYGSLTVILFVMECVHTL